MSERTSSESSESHNLATDESIRVGVCGFCRPQAEVFRRFRLLEVQQTFYWPPQVKTAVKWRATAPDDFEFTVKAFQAITHASTSPTYRRTRFTAAEKEQCGDFRDTPAVREAWQRTAEVAAALGARFIVFQSPPKFDASELNIAQMQSFFEWAPRGTFRFVWEPRHASWTRELVATLCEQLALIHTVDPLEQTSVHGTPRYYRLHGKPKGAFRYDYNHIYSDEQLREVHRHCLPGPTYCLFNNIPMADDVERFEKLFTG